jgi:hypothetical protein
MAMKLMPRDRLMLSDNRIVTVIETCDSESDYVILDENGEKSIMRILDSTRASVQGIECTWRLAAQHRVKVLRKTLATLDKRIRFPILFGELIECLYESTWIRLRQDEEYKGKNIAEQEVMLDIIVDKELSEITKKVPKSACRV